MLRLCPTVDSYKAKYRRRWRRYFIVRYWSSLLQPSRRPPLIPNKNLSEYFEKPLLKRQRDGLRFCNTAGEDLVPPKERPGRLAHARRRLGDGAINIRECLFPGEGEREMLLEDLAIQPYPLIPSCVVRATPFMVTYFTFQDLGKSPVNIKH